MEVLYSVLVVFILPFGVASFVLFYVMKAAVKSAMTDIQNEAKKAEKAVAHKGAAESIIELRYMQILNETEFEHVAVAYERIRANKEKRELYLRYAEILRELKDNEYFNQDQYVDKCNMLKKHFDMD